MFLSLEPIFEGMLGMLNSKKKCFVEGMKDVDAENNPELILNMSK
jgi:hypothetical protein